MKSFQAQTHYELLEISVGATAAEVRSAWERLDRLYAEDQVVLYGLIEPERAAALRARLRVARDVLCDDARRDAYDVTIGLPPREPPRPAPRPRAEPGGAPPAPPVTHSGGWGGYTWVSAVPVAVPSAPGPATWTVPAPVLGGGPPRPRPAAPPVAAVEHGTPAEVGGVSGGEPPAEPLVDPTDRLPASPPPPAPSAPIHIYVEEALPEPELPAAQPLRVAAPPPEPLPPPPPAVPVERVVGGEPLPAVAAPLSLYDEVSPDAATEPDDVPRLSDDVQVSIIPARATPAREFRLEARPRPYEVPSGVEFNGDLLRQVRMARGLSLMQLSERTRIGLKHLENLEGDRYDALPAGVYLRGILMSVARELGLDGLRVSKSYLTFVEAHRSKD